MLKRRTLAAALGAVLAAAALFPLSGLAETETPLLLEAQAAEAFYAPGSTVSIQAQVTNTGKEPLTFWLPTPCDPLFAVIASNGDGETVAIPSEPAEPVFCIQVIRQFHLEPGEAHQELIPWTVPAGLASGEYRLDLRFLGRLDGEAPTLSTPVTVKIQGESAPADTRSHWAASQIAIAMKVGFINGYPDASFRPDNGVSRAELLKMIVAARGLPLAPSLADDHWLAAQGYLGAAQNAGLVSPGSLQQADQPLNREETVKILVRALGKEREAQAAGYATIAVDAGIIIGYEDGTLALERPVTRAEAVVMVLRLLEALAR